MRKIADFVIACVVRKTGGCCKSQGPFYRRLENRKLLILSDLEGLLIAEPCIKTARCSGLPEATPNPPNIIPCLYQVISMPMAAAVMIANVTQPSDFRSGELVR